MQDRPSRVGTAHVIGSIAVSAVILVMPLGGSTMAGTIYKCTAADGTIAFRDQPCAAAAAQTEVSVHLHAYDGVQEEGRALIRERGSNRNRHRPGHRAVRANEGLQRLDPAAVESRGSRATTSRSQRVSARPGRAADHRPRTGYQPCRRDAGPARCDVGADRVYGDDRRLLPQGQRQAQFLRCLFQFGATLPILAPLGGKQTMLPGCVLAEVCGPAPPVCRSIRRVEPRVLRRPLRSGRRRDAGRNQATLT